MHYRSPTASIISSVIACLFRFMHWRPQVCHSYLPDKCCQNYFFLCMSSILYSIIQTYNTHLTGARLSCLKGSTVEQNYHNCNPSPFFGAHIPQAYTTSPAHVPTHSADGPGWTLRCSRGQNCGHCMDKFDELFPNVSNNSTLILSDKSYHHHLWLCVHERQLQGNNDNITIFTRLQDESKHKLTL